MLILIIVKAKRAVLELRVPVENVLPLATDSRIKNVSPATILDDVEGSVVFVVQHGQIVDVVREANVAVAFDTC